MKAKKEREPARHRHQTLNQKQSSVSPKEETLSFHDPSAHSSFRMFPDADPRARKGQLTIEEVQDVDPILDVEIGSGEGVSIPAFYLHHVEVVSPGLSVSVNAFTPSVVGDAAALLLQSIQHAATLDDAPSILHQLQVNDITPVLKRYDPDFPPTKIAPVNSLQSTSIPAAPAIAAFISTQPCAGITSIVAMHILELLAVKHNKNSRDPALIVTTLASLAS